MNLRMEVNGRLKTVDIRLSDGVYRVVIDGIERRVDAASVDGSTFSLICLSDNQTSQEVGLGPTGLPGELAVHMAAGVATVRMLTGAGARFGRGGSTGAQATGAQQVVAPMPGKVVKVLVTPGEEVKVRQGLIVVEAMKMENEIRSPKDGRVAEILVSEGASVEAGRLLVVVT